MKIAIEESKNASLNQCMPFGAVLADENGTIVLKAQNGSQASGKRGGTGDVTRHAEMELVRKASSMFTREERCKYTVYTSTEPCVMCAGAIYWGGFSRVVYGCSSLRLEKDLSGPGGFDIDIRSLYGPFAREGIRKIEVIGPLLEDEALEAHARSGVWAKCQEFLEKNEQGKMDEGEPQTEESLE